ncbi:uncharacterized protein N7482_000524 [Penicillium canariense]|uniref:Uncharacterized protein n=1 Tax=Penicillium canariense TaxID=189055 RepID=A0A9W9LT79_9EURO|nr:uncharacterized protein N7482_000524 [Penicillium canariense]KAJ5174647.1 hypothetical protein N7482_000524 [Penicillium canariense]
MEQWQWAYLNRPDLSRFPEDTGSTQEKPESDDMVPFAMSHLEWFSLVSALHTCFCRYVSPPVSGSFLPVSEAVRHFLDQPPRSDRARPRIQKTSKTQDQETKIMLRRPPTNLALSEDDINSHLQRILHRTILPVNMEQLSLEDPNQCYDARHGPSSDDYTPAVDKSAGFGHRTHGSIGGSSCMGHFSSTSTPTQPALPASKNGSTHRTTIEPHKAPTTTELISSILPQHRAARPREPSRPRTKLTIPPQEFLNRRILPSPDGRKGLPVPLKEAPFRAKGARD